MLGLPASAAGAIGRRGTASALRAADFFAGAGVAAAVAFSTSAFAAATVVATAEATAFATFFAVGFTALATPRAGAFAARVGFFATAFRATTFFAAGFAAADATFFFAFAVGLAAVLRAGCFDALAAPVRAGFDAVFFVVALRLLLAMRVG